MECCSSMKEVEQALSLLYQHLIGRQSTANRRSSAHTLVNSRRQHSAQIEPAGQQQQQADQVIAVDTTTGHSAHQITKDLEKMITRILDERDELAADRDQLQQIVEAARRERVMAIEERDKIVHRHHILKISIERNEATLKLIEGEKSRLMTRCEVLEQELTSLRQSLLSAEKIKLSLIEEQSKASEERKILREELRSLQQDKDTVMASRSQLETELHRSLNNQIQLRTELDRMHGCYQYLETHVHSLQQQNEVLCAKSCQIVEVVMDRTTGPWGFSIEGGHGSEYFTGDPSIVITGIAPNTPAMNSLRYGDRLLSVEDQTVYGLAKTEAIELLSSLATRNKLRLCLKRMCSPDKPHRLIVQLPDRHLFEYKAHYNVSRSDYDMLCVGDHIIKVMDKTVDGLRSSQLRKLLKHCSSGVTMEVERMSSHHHHPDSERMSSHHHHPDSERMSSHHHHPDSERMSSHHPNSIVLHDRSLQDTMTSNHNTSLHDGTDSVMSPSLHSSSPSLPSNKILTPTTSVTNYTLPTNSHKQTDV